MVFGVSILFGCQLLWLVGFVFRWLVGFIVRLDSDDFGRVCVLSSSFFRSFFFFPFFLSAFQQGICTVQWVPCIVHGTHKYFIRKKN